MKNSQNDWSGISIALWRSIAKENDFEFQFREYTDVSSLLEAVEQTEGDLGIAAITVTAAREDKFDFSLPY